MAYKNNQSGITIGGYVPQRVPVRSNLEALSQALNKIDERSDKAIQQKSAITNAIGQLKLNAAEDKWKYDYAKRIEQKINDAAQYGDYSRALDVATELAGSATSSPEVTGRIRANEQYEKQNKLWIIMVILVPLLNKLGLYLINIIMKILMMIKEI